MLYMKFLYILLTECASENWLIIDDNRKKSVVHTTDGQMYIRYFTDYDMSVLAKTEDVNDEYTDMWKIFF